MTEENKPAAPTDNTVHTGEGTADSSNFQPTIDAHQVGASEAYGEGSIQILEGLLLPWHRDSITSSCRRTQTTVSPNRMKTTTC